MKSPAVSVILPFYRNPLVREAVDSILSQTYQDFELIAIDDCSGNGVAEVLADIADPRLRLVRQEKNGGENATRNHGIELARGRYVAFQDHDDISYPTRLETQVRFMDAHPAILGCGTACHYGESKVVHTAPTDPRLLRWEMIFNNHVMFPTVMTRLDVARKHPFGDMVATDDYRWLFEVMAEGDFVNLPEIVFHYRMQPTSLSRERAETQLANQDICRARFARDIGVDCDEREIRLLRWLGTPRGDAWPSVSDLEGATDLLHRLVSAFLDKHPGTETPVKTSALSRMRYATTVSSSFGLRAFLAHRRLRKRLEIGPDAGELKLLAKCALSPAMLFAGRIRG